MVVGKPVTTLQRNLDAYNDADYVNFDMAEGAQ